MEEREGFVTLKKEDLLHSGWSDIIKPIEIKDYFSMSSAFFNAARLAEANSDRTRGKLFHLLASACSMRLVPDELMMPFAPVLITQGKRSWLPEDFKRDELDFFYSIVEMIDDPLLRARITDLLWVSAKPRDPQMAILAIDAYCAIPIDTESWLNDGRDCWERATRLALMLRREAGSRLSGIETRAVERLISSNSDDAYLPIWIANLLRKNHLGFAQAKSIAVKLQDLADEYVKTKHFLQAGDFFNESREWFIISNDKKDETNVIISYAETFVKEAHQRIIGPHTSFFAAASLLETAIQKYRAIPRSERSGLGVDKRIEELRIEMENAQEKSVKEMIVIESEKIDISDIVEKAKNAVRGIENPLDSMTIFCNTLCHFDIKKLESDSRNDISSFFHTLFPATYTSKDGRVVAKRAGLATNDVTSLQEKIPEDTLRPQMIHNYLLHINLSVHGQILPAIEVMRIEHRLDEQLFTQIACGSPVVPVGRESLFGKGLYAGYNGDYITAIHLLCPQLENMVRGFLKNRDIKTTVKDSLGIETENGLSYLANLPEILEIFGERGAFELKALFCDSFGPNLRNNIAHGLLDGSELQSCEVIYAWWWILRLTLNGFMKHISDEVLLKNNKNS